MKKVSYYLLTLLIPALMMQGCGKDDNNKTTYTVSFDANGGSPTPAVQNIEAGKTAKAPSSNPTKTGYIFVFWNLDGATSAYNFQTPVNSNILLEAKWQEEATAEYWQVSWELNGGAWASGDNHADKVIKGGTLAEPTAPAKSDNTFEGWYKDATLTNKIDFPYDVSNITGDISLYAKWKSNIVTPPSNNHNISNAAEWNAAVAAVNAAGNGKNHTFTVTKSFSLPGVGTTSIFAELTGLTVTIKGQGSPVPEISLSSVGYLIYLSAQSQTIALENIVLKGRTNNNAAVIGVKSGEFIIGNGAVITGNTNRAGGSGGVDVAGKLILNGGEITDNVSGTTTQNGQGGGVWIDYKGDFFMESGSISGNTVYGQGGGVSVGLFARFIMKGGIIFGNTARATANGARGGGVYNAGGDFHMSGGKIAGYGWEHGDNIGYVEHFPGEPVGIRDDCNMVVIGVTAMSAYGASLYSPSGDNYYGTFDGGTFHKTGDFGTNIHSERDFEIVDGVWVNRFNVNGSTYNLYSGQVDYCGHFFNASTENVWLQLANMYGEWIAVDMLVPNGNNKLVAGTYTFNPNGATAPAYTFVNNDYTSYAHDIDGNRLRMTAGTVKVSITGTGDNAVYTIAIDCSLENGGSVKGTYRGTLKWYDMI